MGAAVETAGDSFVQGVGEGLTKREQIFTGEGSVWHIGIIFLYRSHWWDAHDATSWFYLPALSATLGAVR